MSEEFLLECRVDQPAVLAGQGSDVYVMTTINPNPARLGSLHEVGPGAVAAGAPHRAGATCPGRCRRSSATIRTPDDRPRHRRGAAVAVVETNVPSRLAVAQGVVRRLIDRMKPADRLTLVAFDHQAYPLLAGASAADKLPMYRAAASLARDGRRRDLHGPGLAGGAEGAGGEA